MARLKSPVKILTWDTAKRLSTDNAVVRIHRSIRLPPIETTGVTDEKRWAGSNHE
jgi:hypothetical protein